MARPPVIALFNGNDDVAEMLRIALEHSGLVVVSASLSALRRGRLSLADLVGEHDPRVIVYDLAPPYDGNWRFLEHLRAAPAMRGRPFVFTSANAARAREIAGTTVPVHEIAGNRSDLDEIVRAVRSACTGLQEPPGGPLKV